MNYLNSTNGIQKIGEIIVVSPSDDDSRKFIQAVCRQAFTVNHAVTYGEMEINKNLSLYFYGIGYKRSKYNFAWELVAKKVLGYVILFNWYDDVLFAETKEMVHFLTLRVEAPIIIAGDVQDHPFPVGQRIFQPSITLSRQTKFMLCRLSERTSVKKIIISLLDSLIDQMV
jgi:signal recognition particle receptor subunit beta